LKCHPCCATKSFDDLIRFNLSPSGLEYHFRWTSLGGSPEIMQNLVKLHSYGLLIEDVSIPEAIYSKECLTTFIMNDPAVPIQNYLSILREGEKEKKEIQTIKVEKTIWVDRESRSYSAE
jgi:hypothetical protein